LILEQITTHEANKNSNFDPLKLLRKNSATVGGEEEKNEPISQLDAMRGKKTNSKGMIWALILCHGGKFIVQVF